MSLETTKTLLGVDNERITIIYGQMETRLLARLRRDVPDVVQVPQELDFVVQEASIARYNRIGSEGMEKEDMDGHSATYIDRDLHYYEHDIVTYIESLNPEADKGSKGVVRFI